MKITGCCLPYGESKYHDAIQVGAWAVGIKKEAVIKHELPSKFGNDFIVTYGHIAAIAINRDCLERIVIEDE